MTTVVEFSLKLRNCNSSNVAPFGKNATPATAVAVAVTLNII